MASRAQGALDLIADIGGTNARFALRRAGRAPDRIRVLPTAGHPGLAAAARAYLDQVAPDRAPDRAAIAVASPVTGPRVRLTNRDWSFSVAGLKRALGVGTLHVINDFVAIAHAVPRLQARDWLQVGGGAPARGAPVAVLGPGTGLGVALLVPHAGRFVPVATEGGHVTLAAADDADAAIVAALRARLGHVSAERVLSGPGLVNLYQAIAAAGSGGPAPPSPAAITDAALAGTDETAERTLEAFCGFLGTTAGNLALTAGARGGVYIAGGIVPRFADRLAETPFRRRFEEKGRFKEWLAPVPVRVVMRQQPALLGLCHLLDEG